MKRDKADREHSLQTASRLRGLFTRIAVRFGVDPSFVSRVSRGERKSEVIEAALREKLKKILGTKET